MLLSASLPICFFCLVLFLSTIFLHVCVKLCNRLFTVLLVFLSFSLPFALHFFLVHSFSSAGIFLWMCEVYTTDAIICIYDFIMPNRIQTKGERDIGWIKNVKFHNWIVFTWIEHVWNGSFTVRPHTFFALSFAVSSQTVLFRLNVLLRYSISFFLVEHSNLSILRYSLVHSQCFIRLNLDI